MNDYRNVLVHVSDSERSDAVLSCAAMVAAAHGANLRAVHAVQPLYLGVGLTPESAMIAAQHGQEAERDRTAKARYLVLEASRASGMSIEFESPRGDPVESISERSWVADLAVMGQPFDEDMDGPSRRIASKVLVAAGCPVLFVPGAGFVESCGTRVLVAWSATAARAGRATPTDRVLGNTPGRPSRPRDTRRRRTRASPARPAWARQRRARRCRCASRDERHGRDASSPAHRRPARCRDSTAPRSHMPGRRGRGRGREQAVEVDGPRVGRRCQPWPFAAKGRSSASRCSSGSWSQSLRIS